jgi:hypothetical protein
MLIPRIYIDLRKSAEKADHKYISREGTPGNYTYTYPGDEQGAPAKPADEEKGLSMASLQAAAIEGVDPEKNYKNALQTALRDGKAPLQHPNLPEDLSIRVHTTKKGSTIHLDNADGTQVLNAKGKPLKFPNQARFEQWYIGTASTMEMAGLDGKPWVHVKPNLSVSKGELKAAKDPYKQWVIEYDPSVPAENRPVELDRGRFGQSATKEGAIQQVETAQRAMAGANETVKDESKHTSIAAKMDESVYPVKPDPTNPKKTVLNVSDDKKEQL